MPHSQQYHPLSSTSTPPAADLESPEPHERAVALAALEHFTSRLLPHSLTRLGRWKNFDPNRHPTVVEDIRQDLAVDALEHAHEIAGLSPETRNARWFRLVQSSHYRLCIRPDRRRDDGQGWRRRRSGSPEVLPSRDACYGRGEDSGRTLGSRVGEATATPYGLARLGGSSFHELDRLAAAAVHLGNGRLNIGATAQRLGRTKRDFVELWERLATNLGFGHDYTDFWRARLFEASVRLAVDQLRALGALHTFGSAFSDHRADPEAGMRRVRRARIALSSHPQRPDTKRLFHEALVQKARDPVALLDATAALSPHRHDSIHPSDSQSSGDPRLELWRFEAAIAYGENERASDHLKNAAEGVEDSPELTVPHALATARLHEARGDLLRARLTLRDAQHGTQHRAAADDPRLERALRALQGLRHRD